MTIETVNIIIRCIAANSIYPEVNRGPICA